MGGEGGKDYNIEPSNKYEVYAGHGCRRKFY